MSHRIVTLSLIALAPVASAQAPAAKAEDPKQLAVGQSGSLRPGALLQGWYFADLVSDNPDATINAFRIRRAELSLRGEIMPKLFAYRVMIDPAKVLETRKVEIIPDDPSTPDDETVTVNEPADKVSVLQDCYITFLSDWADVSLGQFKIPVSWEGYNSSSKLPLPERAQVARDFGDKRDIGLRAEKSFRYVGYSAGIFNGSELNNREVDDAKDFGLRLEAYPIDGLVVAGVVYATMLDRDVGKKDRFEGDLRYERGPFLLQSEFIAGNDNGTKGNGFYGALGWTFMGKLQPVVRVGMSDPDTNADVDPAAAKNKDEAVIHEYGVNYYLQKNEAKLQLAGSRFEYDDRDPVTTVIAAAQVSF